MYYILYVLYTICTIYYRYDVIKVILENNMTSITSHPQQHITSDPTDYARNDSLELPSRSPGILALAKYWSLDSLLTLKESTLSPVPSMYQMNHKFTKDADEENAIQEHIKLLLKQQDEIQVRGIEDDAGLKYFVDVSRDEALRVSLCVPYVV